MPIQSAAGVSLAFGREANFGVAATNNSTAKVVPFVSHTLGLSKTGIESEEIRPSFQMGTMRHGNRNVGGELTLQLQAGTYAEMMEAAVRRNFTTVSLGVAINTVVAASVGSGGTFTRTGGSWITSGLRVGMTIRMTGWTTTAVANNSRNYTVVALTATVITVLEPVVAKAAGDNITTTVVGRVTWAPQTGHTRDSFTVEEWNPDVPRSFRFLGQRVNTMGVDLTPNARASLTFGLVGRDRVSNAGRYFSSATNVPPAVMQVGHQGLLVANGAASGIVTGLTMQVSNGLEAGEVVGSDLTPDVFYGMTRVSGSVSVYFDNADLDTVFDAETEISLIFRTNDSTAIDSPFLGFALPRIKLAGGSYGTERSSRVQTFQYTALEAPAGGGAEQTTILIQDSSLT
jgi:hypothetical protein